MKNVLFLALLSLAVAFTSCTKDGIEGIGNTTAMEVPIYTTPTPVDGEWSVGRMVVYYSYHEGVSRYQGKGTNDVHVSYTDFAGKMVVRKFNSDISIYDRPQVRFFLPNGLD